MVTTRREVESSSKLRELVSNRPLYLGVETVTTCNARCVFCAYPASSRPHTVMTPELWSKVLADYAVAGGGALSLTPLTGDVLLDPFLPDRLCEARRYRAIGRISFYTNGISWKRFDAAARVVILHNADRILFSVGGLDAIAYREMFGVDMFERVKAAILDAVALKRRTQAACQIVVQLRCAAGRLVVLSDVRLDAFRNSGVDAIAIDDTFHNWGGSLDPSSLPPGALSRPNQTTKNAPCYVFYTAPMVLADGRVTVCGCANPDGRELVLGSIREESLGEIWNNRAYRRFRDTFYRGSPPSLCRNCTYYQNGDDWLADPRLHSFRIGDFPWDHLGDL